MCVLRGRWLDFLGLWDQRVPSRRCRALGPTNHEGLRGRQPTSQISVERRTASTEHRAPSAEHRAPSTERRTPSAGQRAPSTEHQAPDSEHRAPSTEHRTASPSAEHRAPDSAGSARVLRPRLGASVTLYHAKRNGRYVAYRHFYRRGIGRPLGPTRVGRRRCRVLDLTAMACARGSQTARSRCAVSGSGSGRSPAGLFGAEPR
jgi:hypothetical protein